MIEMLLAELDRLQRSYKPNDAVLTRMREVTFVPVIGPFLTGKSTIMDATMRVDRAFGRVRSFTTRPRRAGEPEGLYEFLPHTEATLRQLLHDAEAQELVHFTLHPTTKYLYGTRPAAWLRHPFMMLDFLPTAFEAMKPLEFKAVRPIAVTTEPDRWAERLHGRDDNAEERSQRLREGVNNIEWCLAHDIAWIVNSSRTPAEAAKQLIAIVKRESAGDANGPAVAERLLVLLRELG